MNDVGEMSNGFTSESVYVKMTRYRDDQGHPTCAANFETKQVCPFHILQGVCGQRESCYFAEWSLKERVILERRGDDKLGSLIPHGNCPVWNIERGLT